jgi:hypothetical protein
MDSRCVFGTVGPSPVSLAIKFARAARFTIGAELVDNTKLVATLFAEGEASGDGDGDGAPPVNILGVSSRLIVLVSIAARAGAWRELRLMTPPRGVAVGEGYVGGILGEGLGVGVAP